MGGERLHAVRVGALEFLDRLGPNDRLTLVAFGSEASVLLLHEHMNEEGRAHARRSLAEIDLMGTTFLSGGWELGATMLGANRRPGCRSHLVLLSDGHANRGVRGPSELAHLAGDHLERGTTTTAIGIGDDYSDVQLRALAEAGGGRLHRAALPSEVTELLTGELHELNATAAEAVCLEVGLPAAEARALGNRSEATDRGLLVPLGPLVSGLERTVVIELDRSTQSTLPLPALVEATGRRPGTDEVLSARCEVDLSSPTPAGLADREVRVLLVHHWAADLEQRASEANRCRDFHSVHRLLEGEVLDLVHFAGKDSELRQVVELCAHRIHRLTRRMREGHRKEIALASYKLTKGERDLRGPERGGRY